MKNKVPKIPSLSVGKKNTWLIEAVDKMLALGLKKAAAEIILAPASEEQEHCLVQFNNGDGTLRSLISYPRRLSSAVRTRLKILGNLSISEHRVSQVGTWNYTLNDGKYKRPVFIYTTVDAVGEVVRVLYPAKKVRQ